MTISGSLALTIGQLNLGKTLVTGQSFRWRSSKHEVDRWIGILENELVVSLKQGKQSVDYELLNSSSFRGNSANLKRRVESALKYFFNLEHDIDELYCLWSKQDKNFAKIANDFRGIRLLRQEVTENIFSFICSSNNNITRITKMVDDLARNYGKELCTLAQEDDLTLHSFPTIDTLAQIDPIDLKGFGYRAKSIVGTAKKILEQNSDSQDWIATLCDMNYEESRAKLMELPGIGPKVADCICLMSLNHGEAVPIDTHVKQVTERYYSKHIDGLKMTKSITKNNYEQIGRFYREHFKQNAGWAQTVLFCSNLLRVKDTDKTKKTKKATGKVQNVAKK